MILETKLCIFGLCTVLSMVMPDAIAMKREEGINLLSALLRQFVDFRVQESEEETKQFLIIKIWPIINLLFWLSLMYII